eukprot:CAMPEP_0202698818 /NCGR_PEP_ID=MMETSP1385-20130828/12053_1 /ASSEMBLY_ACC=CAM_ASM_000861 /TAXON_ID=933848 /ORGANISM="Elphidium margaritaceum" /LENGTH=196 /DNA_ID=CAMNT_0049355613 /DNA_START=49 /DNA_END=639 /DNA_ORIENTATION=-
MYRAEVPMYKVVVLGEGAVGKSTLTIRLLTENFLDEYDPTIEDSYRKQINLDEDASKPILLDILDTSGQEEFKSMRDSWIREGDGYLLVYSITSHFSFDALESIRDHILHNKDAEYAPIVIAGNKSDLAHERQVPTVEGQQLADLWNVPFFETSAKNKINNTVVFHQVCHEIQKFRNSVKVDPQKKKRTFKGCVLL